MEGLRHRGEPRRPPAAQAPHDTEEREKLVRSGSLGTRSFSERLQEWFYTIFGRLCGALHVCAGPELTPTELRYLSPFEAHASIPFDHQDPKHQQALRDLWASCSPGTEPPDPSLVFSEWKNFGFQQNDPASDFRAAGVFGLHNLLFFADAYPSDFARMAPETDTGYPFAIAGLNLSMMLLAMLNISGHKTCFETTHGHNKRARKGFAELLVQSQEGEPDVRSIEKAFGSVYCTAFLLLDREWAKLPAPSMLVFNEVLLKVKKQMDELLIAAKSVDELHRLARV